MMNFVKKVSFGNPLLSSPDELAKVTIVTNGPMVYPLPYPIPMRFESYKAKSYKERCARWEVDAEAWQEGMSFLVQLLLEADWLDYAVVKLDTLKTLNLTVIVYKYLDGQKLAREMTLYWSDVFRNVEKLRYEYDVLKTVLGMAVNYFVGKVLDARS